MIRICAWCDKLMLVPQGEVSSATGLSHGICPRCMNTFFLHVSYSAGEPPHPPPGG